MIQRIQTIYLFLSAGLLGGLFALPYAQTAKPLAQSTLFNDSQFELTDQIGLIASVLAAMVLGVVAIFLFKNRKLQITITGLTILLVLAGLLLAGVFYYLDGMQAATPFIGAALPVLSIVFLILARSAIRKDENKVRSMNRLR